MLSVYALLPVFFVFSCGGEGVDVAESRMVIEVAVDRIVILDRGIICCLFRAQAITLREAFYKHRLPNEKEAFLEECWLISQSDGDCACLLTQVEYSAVDCL